METKNMIVSYSEVFRWDTCQRQYYYSFDLGLAPVQMSEAILTGVKGHKLLQSFYEGLQKGLTPKAARDATHEQAKKLIHAGRFPDFGLLQAWTLVDNYIRAGNFNAQVAMVENRFLFPFSNLNRVYPDIDPDGEFEDIQIGFTPDVVFKRNGSFMDVEDSKFVQKAWSQAKQDMFPQAKIYQSMLMQMGYHISRAGMRFFNVTTGKVDAKYYPYDKEEEKTIIHDFAEAVKEVVRHRRNPPQEVRRTMNYTTCQYCFFKEPCGLQAKGKDVTKTLANQYQKNDYSYDI